MLGLGSSGGGGRRNDDNSKEKFHLPAVRGRKDRYCGNCGKTVKFNWDECRNPDCYYPIPNRPPTLPPGYRMCNQCLLGFLFESQHFCRVCHFRTAAGFRWQTENAAMNHQINAMREQFRSTHDGCNLAVIFPGRPAVRVGSLHPAVRLHPAQILLQPAAAVIPQQAIPPLNEEAAPVLPEFEDEAMLLEDIEAFLEDDNAPGFEEENNANDD